MNQINLDQLIKSYGKKEFYKKDTFLFRSGDEDTNIYLIEDGQISLQKDGINIFMLSDGQIFGEKTFVSGESKPIDAKVGIDSHIYSFSKSDFEKLDLLQQKDFFSTLIIYLSERVNSLDTILGFLGDFNEIIIDMQASPNEKMLNFINDFYDIDSYLILKYENKAFQLLHGDLKFDNDLEPFILDLINSDSDVKMGKNYLFMRSGDYVFLFSGKTKIAEYVSANLLYYVRALVQFMAQRIEQEKNADLQKSCEI